MAGAAAAVAQDEQSAGTPVAHSAFAQPPAGDAMSGKGRRVVRDADKDRAAISQQIVNAVGNRDADGIGAEVMIVDPGGRAVPFGAGVLKVADQLALFGIDADHRKLLAHKAGS